MGNLKNKQKYAPHRQIQLIKHVQNVHKVGGEGCVNNVHIEGFEGDEQSNDTKDEEDPIILGQKQKNKNTSIFGNMIISFGKFNCLLKKNHVKNLKRQLLWHASKMPFPFQSRMLLQNRLVDPLVMLQGL